MVITDAKNSGLGFKFVLRENSTEIILALFTAKFHTGSPHIPAKPTHFIQDQINSLFRHAFLSDFTLQITNTPVLPQCVSHSN